MSAERDEGNHSSKDAAATDWLWYLRPFQLADVIEAWPVSDVFLGDGATPRDHGGLSQAIDIAALLADTFLREQLSLANIHDPPVIAYSPYTRDLIDPVSSDLEHTVTKNDMHSKDLEGYVIGQPSIAGVPEVQGWWIRVATAISVVDAALVQMSRNAHSRSYTVRRTLRKVGARQSKLTDLRQTFTTAPHQLLWDPLTSDDDM